jgi:hypothetical protein
MRVEEPCTVEVIRDGTSVRHFGGQRFKVVELAGFNCQLNPPRDLIAHYMDPDVDDLISILIALACLYTDDGWLQVLL